ncbi:hypothetical protein [Gymnodinialimonas sp.]
MSETSNKNRSTWEALLLLLLGGLLGGIVEEVVDHQRELRENTQSFVVTFNGSYYGAHRDNLHRFFVSPDTLAATGGQLTRSQYADWINAQVLADPDLSASVFAISEFYRTLNACAQERRCRRSSVVDAFQPYAGIYYNVFHLALRRADCDRGFPDTETATADIAGLSVAPPARCDSIEPFS